MQLSDTDTVEEALSRLAEFTETSGLVGTSRGHNFKFVEHHDWA